MESGIPDHRSSLALLLGIVDRPRQTFATILASPRWRWVMPLMACIVALALVSAATAEFASEQARKQQAQMMTQMQEQLDSLPEAQRAQTQQMIDRTSSPLFVGGMGFVTRGLGIPIGWLIGAAILYFGLAIGGTELKFGALFVAFSWTWLPFALRDVLAAGWTWVTGTPLLNPGLSYFFATGDLLADARTPLYVLAGLIDLFFVWHIVLVFCLIKAARQRGGAIGLTIIYTLLYLALRFLPALLSTRLAFNAGS
jgi:ElaB/YqjD/DUF883 family membrane-anchored ribosome-binding protein